MVIYCATSNPGKLAEFRMAAPPGLCIETAGPFDCPETGSSFEENAIAKALCYAERIRSLVFADDSGLVVDELGGAPGIHSARYAGEGASDEENRRRLLQNLKQRSGSRWPARFVCVIALALPGRLLGTFHGAVEGQILDAPAGSGGFGYDPLFYFPPLGRTFAEMTGEEKTAHSHRGQAFRALLNWLDRGPAPGIPYKQS